MRAAPRSNPPTALFAAQNLITIGAVRALHALGLQREIAMVSFDDIPLADAVEPGITVIAQDPRALGRAAPSGCSRGSTATTGRPSASCCRPS